MLTELHMQWQEYGTCMDHGYILIYERAVSPPTNAFAKLGLGGLHQRPLPSHQSDPDDLQHPAEMCHDELQQEHL